MPDRQNRGGGRWLQRTADRGPDYPEPEWQYIPPDRDMLKITYLPRDAEPDRIIDNRQDGDGPCWPDLPNGRILIEIVDGQDASASTEAMEDDWAGPDWKCGASLSDFIRHLSPDIWQPKCHRLPFRTYARRRANSVRRDRRGSRRPFRVSFLIISRP